MLFEMFVLYFGDQLIKKYKNKEKPINNWNVEHVKFIEV